MLDKDASERPDAQAVFDALVSAGFQAGPAPAAYSAERQTSTPEFIEASDAIRPTKVSGPVAASATDKGGSGITPRTMGISLLVLVAVLIGVVFILPNTISTGPDQPTAGGEPAPGSGQATEDTAADAEAPDGDDRPGRDARVVARDETEEVLGQLLSRMDTLERRAVQRWGGLRYKQAQEVYEQGDAAYLARDYATASDKYLEAIGIVDPLLDEVDVVFATTFANAQAALELPDSVEALRLFELAVAISPSHAAANAGYQRARNLDTVLSLTDSGFAFEKNLELEAARQSFERAVEIDPEWLPAQAGLLRVNETIRQMEFDLRMTEGLYALSDGYFEAARAAFRMAQKLKPGSPEPADGLLQVDQGIRLNRITELEQLALQQQENEQWETVVTTYQGILEIDDNLEFAQQGLAKARQMTALFEQLDTYIEDPDRLSTPSIMQRATTMVVNITRMPEIGPRLGGKRDELARLLKRAATPLTVQLISDNVTSVSIYKVGKLGSFATHELSLRPGTYVAVGSRPGYRDVRLEFLVGPELEPKPVVIRCEEAI
jgi:tetratricopeptide (TPR) repeat protein